MLEKEDSAVVSGLYLEGARWDFDNNFLGESLPKVLYCQFPLLVFRPSEDF